MPKKRGKKSRRVRYSINLIGDGRKGIGKLVRSKIKLSKKKKAPLIFSTCRDGVLQEGLDMAKSAFEKGQLVGILDPVSEDISALYTGIGLEMDAESDSIGVEFFGIKRESDGIRQVTIYAPPEVYSFNIEKEHINADGSKQIANMDVGTVRMYPSKAWSKERVAAILKHIDRIHKKSLTMTADVTDEEKNLATLAEAFKDQRLYPVGVLNFKKKRLTNYFQITSFAYSCHSENDGSDWYYVYQIGQFSPSNGFFRNAKRQRAWYVDNYKMDAWPADYPNDTAVSMIKNSPSTTTGSRTAVSSVSYSISGNVSYSDKGKQASVSGGMSISKSLSISIPDLSIYNKSVDRVNNAHWEFVIPKVSGRDDGCLNDLNSVVPIAHNTFQPQNQWIWRADPKTRNKGRAFRVTTSFAVELVNTYIGACNIFGCNCDVDHQKYNPFPKGARRTFSVPFPPIGK